MGRLEGKTALVTGAARGTGEVTARLFVAEGARVVLADVLDAEGGAVARSLGAAARYLHLDVTAPGDWARALAEGAEAFGPLDILVNNAAVFLFAALKDTSAEAFERVLRVNLLGPFLGIQAAAHVMRGRGGAIVNVASTDALKGREYIAAYAASKWGLRGLTRVAALELGRHGIRVNAVCPEAGSGDFIRPFLPEGIDPERVLAASHTRVSTQKQRSQQDRLEDVARMICFLASDEAASCSGAEFVVDNAATAGDLLQGLPGH